MRLDGVDAVHRHDMSGVEHRRSRNARKRALQGQTEAPAPDESRSSRAPPVRTPASLGTSGSRRWALPLVPCRSGQSVSPALADIIGAPRVRTAVMISSG